MASFSTKLHRVWRRRCANRLIVAVILVMTPIIFLSARYHQTLIKMETNELYERGHQSEPRTNSQQNEKNVGQRELASHLNPVKPLRNFVNNSNRDTNKKDDEKPRAGSDGKDQEKKSDVTEKQLIIGDCKVVYKGCYDDHREPTKRTLQGTMWHDPKMMTIAACVKHCDRKGYAYAGLQFSMECWCSNALRTSALTATGCNMTCTGNKQDICGGPLYLSVYKVEKQPAPIPDFLQSKDEGETDKFLQGTIEDYKGCVPTARDGDIFQSGSIYTEDTMTILSCKGLCLRAQYSIAALRSGTECHCGHLETNFDYHSAVNNSQCITPCAGFEGHYCGGRGYASVYTTSADDPRCLNSTLKREGSMPLVALASFPGSGNTWVRHLIERSTGIYTGSFYTDGELFKKGFKGEREHWKKRNTVVVKTHDFSEELIKEYEAAIVVIRNPYKAMIAEHNRKFGGHTGYATEDRYTKGTEWNDFVMGKSRSWTNTALMWLQHCPKVLVIHYEDLMTDLNNQLRKMLTFLNIEINQERLLCAELNSSGKFKRPNRKKGMSFDPFTQEMHEYVQIYVKTVAMALQLHKQAPLPAEYAPNMIL
ncbi:sialate:O-sulfotransferase 2-like [Glandiceps talaboti]